jgi:hypothetical protein
MKRNIKPSYLLVIVLTVIILLIIQALKNRETIDLNNHFLKTEFDTAKRFLNKENIKTKIIDSANLTIPKTIYVNNIPVDILQNNDFLVGDILVFPGWNFKRNLWCDSSDLCTLAQKKGYRLIMPEMGKSVYSSCFYPETRKDWRKYPDINWVTDSLIPFLRKRYGIFSTKRNYLLGLSTGARGVILVGLKTDTLFKRAAALSGDYNQVRMQQDNLMTGYYGKYEKFKDRWKRVDNPLTQVSNIKFDLYLGHGKNDKIVSYLQTKELFDSIEANNKKIKIIISTPDDKGHNFNFWNSELDRIFSFFDYD